METLIGPTAVAKELSNAPWRLADQLLYDSMTTVGRPKINVYISYIYASYIEYITYIYTHNIQIYTVYGLRESLRGHFVSSQAMTLLRSLLGTISERMGRFVPEPAQVPRRPKAAMISR